MSDVPAPGTVGRTLFRARGFDADGAEVAFVVKATPEGLSFIVVTPDREQYGVALDKQAAQQVRHAITGWLVDASPTGPPRAT